jgi:glyoxylase-like metal-dependent hydrolase (beta-lactamase superfamily II)
MLPTSQHQFVAARYRVIPQPEVVRDGLWAVPLAMPHRHIPYSLLYLIRDHEDALHVIDPGWDDDRNWNALNDAVAMAGGRITDIRTIIATHLHSDHIAMASRLRAATGARVMLGAKERSSFAAQPLWHWSTIEIDPVLQRWGVPESQRFRLNPASTSSSDPPRYVGDVDLQDGDPVRLPGFELRVVDTPGHTVGHISLRDDSRQLLFTGDHVIPTMHGGLGLGGPGESNALADFLESSRRLEGYDDFEVLPGHGYRFRGLGERLQQSAHHHLRRTRDVAEVLARMTNPTVWDVASRIRWSAGFENLTDYLLYSALLQTEIHTDYVMAGEGLDYP